MSEKGEKLIPIEELINTLSLSRFTRLFIFIIFFIIYLFNCCDGGVVNASSNEIKMMENKW